MKVFVFAENVPGTAITNMALQLTARLKEMTDWEVASVDKIGQIAAGSKIINLMPDQLPKLVKQRRYVPNKGLVTIFSSNPQEMSNPELAFTLMHAHGTEIVAHSQYTYSHLSNFAKTLFAPSIARELLEHVHHIDYGIEEGFEPSKDEQNYAHRWVVPTNRYVNSQKRLKTQHEIHQKAVNLITSKRGDANIKIDFAYHPKWRPNFAETPFPLWNSFEQETDRALMKKRLQKYGIFVSTSAYESFGLFYLELLFSGVIGLFVDHQWVRNLLPGYPLITGAGDMPAMLCWAHENPWEAHEKIRDAVNAARTRYSLRTFTEKLITLTNA